MATNKFGTLAKVASSLDNSGRISDQPIEDSQVGALAYDAAVGDNVPYVLPTFASTTPGSTPLTTPDPVTSPAIGAGTTTPSSTPSADDTLLSDYLTQGFWTEFTGNGPPPHSFANVRTALDQNFQVVQQLVPIDVAIDPSSKYSADEIAGIQNAIATWKNVANINLVFDTPTGNSTTDKSLFDSARIRITRGADGSAATGVSYFPNRSGAGSNELLTNYARISIDTSVGSFRDMNSIAQQDKSGYGGYGFQTLVHELGHALGLGHAGAYNGTVDYSARTLDHDSRQYSIMSYFNPQDVGGSANDVTAQGQRYYDQTPMLDDILAVQSLYGAPVKATGAVTFGFNATPGLIREYDYTIDQIPIETLSGGNANGALNTWDLSQFTGPATINLNSGAFSSFASLIDNVSIAFGTTIDNAVGTKGGTTFIVNGDNDTLTGQGTGNIAIFSGISANYTISSNGIATLVSNGTATDTLYNIQSLQFADKTIPTPAPCFVTGTLLLADHGPVAVETIRPGLRLVTVDPRTGARRLSRVTWVGSRVTDLDASDDPALSHPVIFAADAIAPGVPARALAVSPDHAVLIDGLLVRAHALVNGVTITQPAAAGRVTYHHVELAQHAILLAEGMPAESYLDTGNRARFSIRLGRAAWIAAAPCLPITTDPAKLETLWRRLSPLSAEQLADGVPAQRAVPTLDIGGRILTPISGQSGRLTFALPAGARGSAVLRAALHSPADARPWTGDRRRLGLPVGRIVAHGPSGQSDLPIDAPCVDAGWHGVERRDGLAWRWTREAAVLSIPPDAVLLEVVLA